MIVDLIILIIMVSSIFVGLKKGLISCVIDIAAVLVALILAILLCKPITNVVIQNTNFDEDLSKTISQNIPLSDTDFKVEADTNLPEGVVNYINGITENVNTSKEEAFNAIGKELASGIITVIVFISIFIIVRLVLALIKIVSKIIDKIPLLSQVNKIGGAICGAIEGAIIIYVIFAVISMIAPVIFNTNLLELIYNSNIGSIMYNNNLVLNSIYKN